jgi:hypothetical protein
MEMSGGNLKVNWTFYGFFGWLATVLGVMQDDVTAEGFKG